MNTEAKLSAAKLRRMLLLVALIHGPLLTSGLANAQTATATLLSGGSNTITITGNGTFTMSLGVSTNFVSSGYTVFYMVSANASGLLQLTARTNTSPGGIFNDPTTPDAIAFTPANGLLDPRNNNDLGYTGDQVNNQPPGTFSLQTITVTALNMLPGQYTISTSSAIMTDRTGGGFNDVPMSAMLTINVIPEPTTVGLAIIGGAALLVVGWRKRARA
jgi:hypothetical protein